MRKMKKMLKKVFGLFLSMMLCLNSFAAIVSDNDGGAFITKAEFDSLRNDFQSQINSYQTSIDSKIDGAIASYLSGIKVNEKPINRWAMLIEAMGEDLWFANSVSASGTYATSAGSSSNTSQLFINASRHYTYKYSKFTTGWHAWNSSSGKRIGLEFGVWPSSKSVPANDWSSNSYKYAQIRYDKANATDSYDLLSTSIGSFSNGSGGWTENSATNNINSVLDATSVNLDGSGSGWVYHKRGDGKMILREYCSKICPGQVIDAQWHTYLDKTVNTAGWSVYTSSSGLSDTTSKPTITVTAATTWGVTSSGTKRGDNNTTTDSKYWKRNQFKVSSNNKKDYSVIQWGAGCNTTIYSFADDISPANGTQTSVTVPDGSWNSLYFTKNGGTLASNSAQGFELKYTPLVFTPETKYIYNFINDYISSSAGEIVYLGGGAPLLETAASEQNIEVKLNFKLRNAGTHASASGNVTYYICDKQFNRGSLATGAKTYASGTVTAGTEVTKSFIVPTKSTVWINFYASTSGYEATLSSLSIRTK